MKKLFCVLAILSLLIAAVCTLVACDNPLPHTHTYSAWTVTTDATCYQSGKEQRNCTKCSHSETRTIDALEHEYDEGVVTVTASCKKEGAKLFTCTECEYTTTEAYTLPVLTATEINEQAVLYTGEIITYDKSGAAYALGTGFVMSADGKIVTNYHVIEGAYSADITINGKNYKITGVLAYDADIDLAVLQINVSEDIPYAPICKESLKTGETVFALGSSRGMTNTCSQGIITYAERKMDGVTYVQHDASITHGNSGGPLINTYGEVIGINTWGVSDSQNLNFAVFVEELDNLSYNGKLTMAQFYEKECNAYKRLQNYIVSYGSYSSSGGYYSVTLGTDYSDDNKYTRRAYYYPEDEYITLDFIINDGEHWCYFIITEDLSGQYNWSYFNEDEYYIRGTLYASSFTSSTTLSYSTHNATTTNLRDALQGLASSMMHALCSCLNSDLSAVGISAADLQFRNY